MSFRNLVSDIQKETSLTPQNGSPPAKLYSVIDPALAAERAKMLFGCYRKADANDPEMYAAAVTAILSEYDEETVAYVTDPRTGIARKSTFLPTLSEIDKACKSHSDFIRARDNLIAKGWRLENNRWIRPGEAA